MRWLFISLFFIVLQAQAGDSTKLYNPKADAAKDVALLLAKAKSQKKHVLLQIGGNWCVPCYRFNAFIQTDSALKNIVVNSYLVYHLNYSPENRNMGFLKTLGYPQRFGFPVLVVLDAGGNRLHTQDTGLLQRGNGYDNDKVKAFLLNWAPTALDEHFYNQQP